jgi:hypothetical protein
VGWGVGSGIGSVDAHFRQWVLEGDVCHACIKHLGSATTGSSSGTEGGEMDSIMFPSDLEWRM